jgi:hypothetical protein
MYTSNLSEGAVIPPQVAVGGRLAQILYFGDAPGYPGYSQVSFRVPAGVASASAVNLSREGQQCSHDRSTVNLPRPSALSPFSRKIMAASEFFGGARETGFRCGAFGARGSRQRTD